MTVAPPPESKPYTVTVHGPGVQFEASLDQRAVRAVTAAFGASTPEHAATEEGGGRKRARADRPPTREG